MQPEIPAVFVRQIIRVGRFSDLLLKVRRNGDAMAFDLPPTWKGYGFIIRLIQADRMLTGSFLPSREFRKI